MQFVKSLANNRGQSRAFDVARGLCRTAVLAAAALLLIACQRSPEDDIRITDARVAATPPGASVAAAYMTIASSRGDTLLSATTPAAQRVEMHQTSREGGMARMRPLEAAAIPSAGQFLFEPGGAHFMLIGLHTPLAEGSTISMTLRFDHAGERSVSLQVVAPGAAAD